MEMEVSGEAVRDGIGVLGIGAAECVVEGLQRASLMRSGGFVGTGARGQQDADKQDEQENEHRKSLLMQ